MNNKDTFNGEYLPYIIKWGKLTGFLAILLSFGPALVLAVLHGIVPPVSAMITGFVTMASAIGVMWVIEPVSYFPIIGVAGTYMAFISGNISNLRIPAVAVSQKAAGVEPGTDEGSIISTLGMGVSVVVNIVILAIGVLAGATLLAALPQGVVDALNFLLPALFGAVFVQFALMKKLVAPFALAIALALSLAYSAGLFSFLPGIPSYVVTLGSVFGTIAIGVAFYKKDKKIKGI
jgi:hypothetical protein